MAPKDACGVAGGADDLQELTARCATRRTAAGVRLVHPVPEKRTSVGHTQVDVDIAAGCVGIRADLKGLVHQCLGVGPGHARHLDLRMPNAPPAIGPIPTLESIETSAGSAIVSRAATAFIAPMKQAA